MFQLLIKWQLPVLLVAGISTALLFGLEDLGGIFKPNKDTEMGISAEMRSDIVKKMKLQSMLNGRKIGDQWEQFINYYAKNLNKVKSEGLYASKSELIKFILSQFQSIAHCKNVRKYLVANGATEGLIDSYFRDQLLFQKLNKMPLLAVYSTRAEVLDEYHKRNDSVEYNLFQVKVDDMKVSEEISKDEKEKYYIEHSLDDPEFKESEKVSLYYLFINSDKIEDSEVIEDGLREYYNTNRSNYKSYEYPDEVAPYFEVKDRVVRDLKKEMKSTKANEILNIIDDYIITSASKVSLKDALTECKKENASLSVVEYGETLPFDESSYQLEKLGGFRDDIISRVFGDKIVEYDAGIESANGYFIYQINERISSRLKTLEESDSILIEKIIIDKKNKKAKDTAEKYVSKLTASGNWNSLNYGEDKVSSTIEIDEGLSGELASAAIETSGNGISKLIESPTSYSYVKLINQKRASEENITEELSQIKMQIEQNKMRQIQFAIYTSY